MDSSTSSHLEAESLAPVNATDPRRVPRNAHLLRWTGFNPGAAVFAPLWALGYRVWTGLLVPLPTLLLTLLDFVLGDLAISFQAAGRIQNLIDSPLLYAASYSLPAIWFGLQADRMAWAKNPGRWEAPSYRKQQLIWTIAAASYLVVTIASEVLQG